MKTIITAVSALALSAGIAAAAPADNYQSKIGDLSLFGLVDGGNANETLDLRGASGFTTTPDGPMANGNYQSKIGKESLFGQVGGGAVEDGRIVKTRSYK